MVCEGVSASMHAEFPSVRVMTTRSTLPHSDDNVDDYVIISDVDKAEVNATTAQ